MVEKIKQKLEQLSAEKERALAQLNAILGAEQALKSLIDDEGNGEKE